MELAVMRSLAQLVADQENSSSESTSSESASDTKDEQMDDYVEDVPFDEKNIEPSVIAYVSNERTIAIENLKTFEEKAKTAIDEYIELLFQHNHDTIDFDNLMNKSEILTENSAQVDDTTNIAHIKTLGVRFFVLEAETRDAIRKFMELLNEKHDESDEEDEDVGGEVEDEGDEDDDGEDNE